MEIQIFNPTQAQPLPEISWNYAELKQQLEAGLANYKGLAYSDDQIGEAKKDRAKLNKLADAIDGKRKEMKALYLRPYEAFEAQAKELVGMVKATVREIDDQVKAYEAARKEEKLRAIQEQYRAMIGDLAELAPYERLHNPRWLNATAGMGAICQELGNKIDRITAGLTAIDGLQLPPELAGPVKAIFLRRFDLPETKPFKEYSRGMKMKLALAVALSHKAKLLLLDEATGGLDPLARDELIGELSRFISDGEHAILLFSHIVSDIEKLCGRVAFLHKGRLILSEEKEALLAAHPGQTLEEIILDITRKERAL